MFETAAKLAGINVLFDPEYDTAQTIRPQQIDLSRTTLEQALDQISMVTKSFWKPLSLEHDFRHAWTIQPSGASMPNRW